MSISEAIARVRRGASKSRSSLLDGALSYLGVRLKTDLAARLKSASVPPPLRPLATRLATLIGVSEAPPYSDAASRQLEVVSLDRALARAAQRTAPEQAAAAPSAHPAGDVCPFTGLRADGTLAEAPAPTGPQAASVEQPAPALASEPAHAAPRASAAADDLAGTTRLPIPTAANDASSVVPTDLAGAPEAAASAKSKKPVPKRAPGQAGQPKPAGEKRKEKLAAPQDLTNTSARSANRPANKQSSGKGQTSSRKRRDSGL